MAMVMAMAIGHASFVLLLISRKQAGEATELGLYIHAIYPS